MLRQGPGCTHRYWAHTPRMFDTLSGRKLLLSILACSEPPDGIVAGFLPVILGGAPVYSLHARVRVYHLPRSAVGLSLQAGGA
jgi:hypothetical protein